MTEDANDIKNWLMYDPAPKLAIEDIQPYSKRAAALLARNKNKQVLETHFLQVAGAVSILKGLDYHHDRFISLTKEPKAEHLIHEAVAYINRVGQFHYFASSKLVKSIGKQPPATPLLNALVQFRHKHTAHRSVDKPQPEDNEQVQTAHAVSLGEFGGVFCIQKETPPSTFTCPFWRRGYLTFQIYAKSNDVCYLFIERDHDKVMLEAYNVLVYVLQ